MNGERDIWCAVEAYMLKPPSGVDARLAQLEVPSYACILETIQAMGDAGACVTSIEARLTSNGAPGGLFVSPERKQRISSVTRQLREFTFNTREVAPRESADIESFLSALSDTASLQKFGFGLVDDGFFVNVGRVIASRARPRLRNVYVATASLHLSTLAAALEQLPESMDCIGLRNIRLLSGSWEHALDLLAQKAPRVCLLRNPSGAECEELSEQELDDIFGREDRNNSTDAETYIRRDPSSKKYNPFRYRRDLAEIARQIQAEAAAQLAEEEE
ncbi:hypothetical protein GE09DRAFT_1214583 [Coniochaeta sp. 2T2.1]|nr:hypothetical protein GE09DRAFT_1214583 [Coniochaeta sp. 2T2.1]